MPAPRSTGRIYLDHCATSPLSANVAAAMAECQMAAFGNPSSLHAEGRLARRRLEDAREAIAGILGARLEGPQPDRLIFTSGGTEANNLALLGRLDLVGAGLAYSPLEHPSVISAAETLGRRGMAECKLAVCGEGIVDLEALTSLDAPCVAALMLGSHETGVLQPVQEAARLCRARGGGVHCDAVQAAGKLEIDFRALAVDTLSVAAHKFHGPRGIGALLVRHGVPLEPLFRGGPQEFELRPGTEAVALAVGMQRALAEWRDAARAGQDQRAALRDRFEAQLRSANLGLVVHGVGACRLPHVSSLAFPGRDRQSLLMALDLAGVACSAGSACASGSPALSPALLAMGVPRELAQSSLRFSVGRETTAEQIDEAVLRIERICRQNCG
jgi:cysteine desulfurase